MDTKANRAKWIKALRSKKYKQGYGKLHWTRGRQADSYCCLGVACDLYQKEVGDLEIYESGDVMLYDNIGGALPPKVVRWLGLYNAAGEYGRSRALYKDNDSERHTFKEIANTIEAEPDRLLAEVTI